MTDQSTPAAARQRAIERLATITGESTPERRRNHAEWIVDALLDALRAETTAGSTAAPPPAVTAPASNAQTPEREQEILAARLYLSDRERLRDGVPFAWQAPQIRERYLTMARVAEDEFARRGRRTAAAGDPGPRVTIERLVWEDAGTEDPGDQNAWNTALYLHAVWAIGPNDDGTWSVTLIVKNEHGEETDSIRLADQPTEAAAKESAQAYEFDHLGIAVPTSP